MSECICSSCKNLKNIIDEESGIEECECEFGFPSDQCEECEVDECDITCEHFEEMEEIVPIKVECSKCGKILEKLHGDDDGGDVYCMDCYLELN